MPGGHRCCFWPNADAGLAEELSAAGEIDRLRRFDAMRRAIERRLEVSHRAYVDPVTTDRLITAELRADGFTDWRAERFRMDAAGRISGPLAKVGWRGCAMIGYLGTAAW
jgi:hypothetical protein